MQIKVRMDEGHILELMGQMSEIAKAAKRIEEIAESMENIASQTTLLALETAVLQKSPVRSGAVLAGIGNTVKDATDEMYHQFNLLLDEVSELERYLKDKKELQLKVSGLN